tara:strand:- start:454 stop:5562 length:5109 start_codon:yes stop_codon:yes gene_type:complete
MAKKALEIKDFTGGLNCYSDPRDIDQNSFAQNWNANVSQSGIIKLGGSLFESIRNLPHDNTNQQMGYGLFTVSTDYALSIIDGEFENGYEEGAVVEYDAATPSITLATNSTHVAFGDHNTVNHYKNYMITIYKTADGAAPEGETRRITAYAANTEVATLDSAFSADPLTNGTEYYRIYKWVGDGINFGNGDGDDYLDKVEASTGSWGGSIASFNGYSNYFLRTKTATITDNQSKDLGFITYNPSTSASDFTEDSTDIGATKLESGVEYILCFYCRTASRYYGYVSDAVIDGSGSTSDGTNIGERVPFVQLYSDSVTDGTNTGLYLFQSNNAASFMSGTDSTYGYADKISANYIVNGDFEDGSATGGDGGRSGTYDPPTSWMAYDGNIDHNNNAITYSYITSGEFGEGNTLNMAPGSAFARDTNNSEIVPNCYLYQDLTLDDNQWYELFFVYSSDGNGVSYSITDVSNLTSTGILAAEDEAANDSEATLTVDTTNATNALVKNKEIYTNTGGTIKFFGVCDTVDSTTQITFAGGLTEAVTNNDVLSTAAKITPWTDLPHSGGLTTYKYIGQTATNNNPIPYKFFVPKSSSPGTDKKIRIAFAPMLQGTNVRLDGITVRKSFPDLLSMSHATNMGNPYSEDVLNWTRYQLKFKIPPEYNNATDWVLRLHGGTYGYQNGATGTATTQTVYYDRIRLEAIKNDNLIFLNDNTSTNSKIEIYSNNSKNWVENDLVWPGLKMQPVYDYINGLLKISDANFESGNTNKLFYFMNKKHLAGESEITGYRVRDSAISMPPPLLTVASSDSEIVSQTFNALYYSDTESFGVKNGTSTAFKQYYGVDDTESNWPVNDLKNIGRVMYYHGDDDTGPNGGHPHLQLLVNDTTQFTTIDATEGGHINPFYLTWAGQDGTDNDMGGVMSGITTGDVARIEFEFTYIFSALKWDTNSTLLSTMKHPQFQVTVGKAVDANILDGSPTDAEKIKLTKGNFDICSFGDSNVREATFYINDEPWNMTFDEENEIKWEDSENWPWAEVETSNAGGNHMVRFGSKTFKGVVDFDPGQIVITDDMLMKFEVKYPGNKTLFDCMVAYEDEDNHEYNFTRKEQVKFENINVRFYDNNWTAATDGVTSANIDQTKVAFKFGSPSSQTGIGWSERVFNLAVSSVNIFDEESHLNISETVIGGSEGAASETDISTLTAGECPDVTIYVGDNVAKDEYKKELKFYMKDTESDIWYLQFYVDLEKNKAFSTTSNYSTYGINDTTNNTYSYTIPKEKLLNYNEVDSYESQTLIPQEIAQKGPQELECTYKASVVANNRLYVGNVRQNGRVYGDRMIKSPIGKYNLLPSSNFIDVAINDGDEITALAFYQDKLLQFKNKKVFVINTSGDYEFLEETFDNIGVLGQYQVTNTPFGVVWINPTGCYVFDGKSLTNLIENKIPENSDDAIIDFNQWNLIQTPYSSGAISYNASTKDLVIKTQLGASGGDGYSSGDTVGTSSNSIPDGYVYNIPTKSWYFTNNGFAPRWATGNTGVTSNFAINEDGDIIIYTKDTSTGDFGHRVNDILKWDSSKGNDEVMLDQRGIASADNRRPFIFKTADLTFGDITARKKIYKVYVTYKSVDSSDTPTSANSNVLVKYATNGSQSYTAFDDSSTNYAAATGLTGSTTWATAILTPSSSINNIYSLQLEFSAPVLTPAAVGFQINDISIVYRTKRIK